MHFSTTSFFTLLLATSATARNHFTADFGNRNGTHVASKNNGVNFQAGPSLRSLPGGIQDDQDESLKPLPGLDASSEAGNSSETSVFVSSTSSLKSVVTDSVLPTSVVAVVAPTASSAVSLAVPVAAAAKTTSASNATETVLPSSSAENASAAATVAPLTNGTLAFPFAANTTGTFKTLLGTAPASATSSTSLSAHTGSMAIATAPNAQAAGVTSTVGGVATMIMTTNGGTITMTQTASTQSSSLDVTASAAANKAAVNVSGAVSGQHADGLMAMLAGAAVGLLLALLV